MAEMNHQTQGQPAGWTIVIPGIQVGGNEKAQKKSALKSPKYWVRQKKASIRLLIEAFPLLLLGETSNMVAPTKHVSRDYHTSLKTQVFLALTGSTTARQRAVI